MLLTTYTLIKSEVSESRSLSFRSSLTLVALSLRMAATSFFADRPYGTGNYSYGNFDFDPKYYPTPEQFIANLSSYGFDFQVWAANRAFYQTELYNTSAANGWLFPSINPQSFLGPALNLSIPAAYDYFLQKLSYFPSVGVRGYKIDRGEEGEDPGQ
jgi:alpha-D-xyloside xylohydrolase